MWNRWNVLSCWYLCGLLACLWNCWKVLSCCSFASHPSQPRRKLGSVILSQEGGHWWHWGHLATRKNKSVTHCLAFLHSCIPIADNVKTHLEHFLSFMLRMRNILTLDLNVLSSLKMLIRMDKGGRFTEYLIDCYILKYSLGI